MLIQINHYPKNEGVLRKFFTEKTLNYFTKSYS